MYFWFLQNFIDAPEKPFVERKGLDVKVWRIAWLFLCFFP